MSTNKETYKVGDRVWYVQTTGGARLGTITCTDGEKNCHQVLDVQVDGLDHENWGYVDQFTHLSPMA